MYWITVLMTAMVLGTVVAGWQYECGATRAAAPLGRMKFVLGLNLLAFVGGLIVLLWLGAREALAVQEVAQEAKIISEGMGLAILGAGIPTAASTIGAGLAVGPIGAAALAVVAEKPEAFGRSLIFIGLAEGIAIYGLVVSILLLGKM